MRDRPSAMCLDSFMQRLWYGHARWLACLLAPLSWLFGGVVAGRRAAYRVGLLRSWRVACPVIVIGNITVGGTGKTPFTVWLADELQRRGRRVGIVLRGYRGRSTRWPREVDAGTAWEEVGDEAVLLVQKTGAIVVAGPDRVAAARTAVERGADVVLCDDGLQHYRLQRHCEIAVIDAERGLGNRRLLPAGPLREPPERLRSVDFVIVTRRTPARGPAPWLPQPARCMTVAAQLTHAVSLLSGERRPLDSFKGQRVRAVAGIGHPQAFFDALGAAGLRVESRALPDHAHIARSDIVFDDDVQVLMTEKDAVKCRGIADHRHWSVALELRINELDAAVIHTLIDRVLEEGSG